MKHSHILPGHDVNQFARLNMSDLNETWFESQDVRVVQGKALWRAFPLYLPVWPGSPSVSIDEEAEVGVIEQEFTIKSFNMYWLDVFLTCHKIE